LFFIFCADLFNVDFTFFLQKETLPAAQTKIYDSLKKPVTFEHLDCRSKSIDPINLKAIYC